MPATPPAPAVDPLALASMARLAAQLHLTTAEISVLSVTPANWPDSCLGVPAEGEICAMMITPGHAVVLGANGRTYEFHTDAKGGRGRLAKAPPPETGDPLVTWRDSDSFSMLVVGTSRVAVGRRGLPLLGTALGVPARAEELQGFLARFAPFQARTPAGEVALRGVGAARATPAEQRMLAEWARLVAAEADGGLTEPVADRALVWRRTGGIAGFCDVVVVGRAGTATAFNCRLGEDHAVAQVRLAEPELAQLYLWLDKLDSFSWSSGNVGATADAMTVRLELDGSGSGQVPEAERDRMIEFINTLVRRLVEATGGR